MNENPNLRSEGDINSGLNRADWYRYIDNKKSKKYIERDNAVFLHQSLSTPCLDVIESCHSNLIETISGRKVLDFHGNYVHTVGYSHPKVITAIVEQLQTLSFSVRRYTNIKSITLAEKLTSLTKDLNRVLFAPGGAEAIGIALKIARLHTGRYKTISMWDSFHGASIEASSVGGEAVFRKEIGPLLPGCEHVPPPNPTECFFSCGTCNSKCADYIEYVLEKEGDIAAVVAETVRTVPFIPHRDYWKKVKQACEKHGALLILDEIPTALGRTGRWFAFQHFDIEPDIVVLGKALGGGVMPLAAVLTKNEINDSVKFNAIGHYTHEKNPVAAAAGLALINVIEQENLLEHVSMLELVALEMLMPLKEKFQSISDVRVIGLLIGIEIRDRHNGQKSIDEAEKIMYMCLKNGLNFKLSMGSTVNLAPPINISESEFRRGLSILIKAIETIL